jgi:putative transposase
MDSRFRDTIYSQELELAVRAMGVRILKTPFHSPQANSHCERLIGGLRRDCLDFLIPINEGHLKGILKEWKTHYCQARPMRVWDQGFQSWEMACRAHCKNKRHQIPAGYRVRTKPILGGLHHEYRLEKNAA